MIRVMQVMYPMSSIFLRSPEASRLSDGETRGSILKDTEKLPSVMITGGAACFGLAF
jgi:hypothetical protein